MQIQAKKSAAKMFSLHGITGVARCCDTAAGCTVTSLECTVCKRGLAAAVLSLSCRQKQRHVDSKHTVACIQQQSGGAPEHEVHQVAAIVTQLACK